jgi:hypothetical protein
VKLCIMTACGSIETTGLDEEVAAEFVNTYRNGTERVLYIPDSDPTEQHYVTRSAVIWAATGPDVVVEPGAAEDPGATEGSGTP